MASDPGSLVLDPFGGSGTTYVAAELAQRRWIGSELDCGPIVRRFEDLSSVDILPVLQGGEDVNSH